MSGEITDTVPTVGLNTQQLSNGEMSNDKVETGKSEPSNTIFDIAQEIELKTKELLQAIEKNDTVVEGSLEKVSDRLKQVRVKLQGVDT